MQEAIGNMGTRSCGWDRDRDGHEKRVERRRKILVATSVRSNLGNVTRCGLILRENSLQSNTIDQV